MRILTGFMVGFLGVSVAVCPASEPAGPPRGGAQPTSKVTDHPAHPQRILADALWRTLWFGPDHPIVKESEAAAMLATILKGGSMGGGDGWFHPSSSRFSWAWLATREGVGAAESIARKAWRGPPEMFDRLDRNHDGALSAADFDWSENAPATREERRCKQWLSDIDTDINGKISRKEWESFFERLAAGKDYLSAEDLRRAFPLSPSAGPAKSPARKMPEGFRDTLLKGFFHSELGSPFEGPRVDQAAPDFTLPTQDGKHKITLSHFRHKKPVVLIFGSLT
jgi:hypothetical protein